MSGPVRRGRVNAIQPGIDEILKYAQAAGIGSGYVAGPASAVSGRLATFDGTTGKLIQDGGSAIADVIAAGAAAAPQGDVVGPASAVASSLAFFNGVTGKLITDGGGYTLANLAADIDAAIAADRDAAWTSVAHGDLAFTAQAGTWTVDLADLAYFKFRKVGRVVFLKGAIITSSVSATPTELRVTVPGVTFAGNDSFGFTVLSEDGFATQDTGQSICRVASGLLVFKPRAGGTWLTTVNQTAVIWNLVGECDV